jgi:polygalacturonase
MRVNRPTENVSITNCTVHHGNAGVAMGSETSGWIRNVVASNITCQGTQMGVRLKAKRSSGGGIEDIRLDNWTMEDAGQGINVSNYYLSAGEARTPAAPVTERTPVFRNIAITRMTINRAKVAIYIEGLPEMPISGLRMSDIIASAKTGMKGFNTVALELHNVQVNADDGPAFVLRDSRETELDGITTRKPSPGAPVIRLDHCPGTIVRGSKAFAGTGTFLSVAPGEMKSIVLEANALGNAQKATEESAKEFPRTVEPAKEKN